MMSGQGRIRETTQGEKQLVLAALRDTRPRQYEVLERHLRGMDQTAIAVELGITQGSVSRRLTAAKASIEKLKREVIQRSSSQAQ